jgi:peroxiredoxin
MKAPILLEKALLWWWRRTWKLRSAFAGGLRVGELFPDFSLKDIEGRAYGLSDPTPARHTALWFTNLCEDCRARAPLLEELRREAGERLRVLAVSILPPEDPLSKQVGGSLGFPLLLDPEDIVGKRLGLAHPAGTCPMHNFFILDRKGRVRFRHHLSALKEPDLRAFLARDE